VSSLQDLGLKVWLLTGDNRRTAEAVGAAVGVDNVIAEVFPDDKAAVIRDLQADGHRVAMIGDGINPRQIWASLLVRVPTLRSRHPI